MFFFFVFWHWASTGGINKFFTRIQSRVSLNGLFSTYNCADVYVPRFFSPMNEIKMMEQCGTALGTNESTTEKFSSMDFNEKIVRITERNDGHGYWIKINGKCFLKLGKMENWGLLGYFVIRDWQFSSILGFPVSMLLTEWNFMTSDQGKQHADQFGYIRAQCRWIIKCYDYAGKTYCLCNVKSHDLNVLIFFNFPI